MMRPETKDRPWSFPISVAQIPPAGLHHELTANDAQRERLRDVGGVVDVLRATASFDVFNISGERVQVTGIVKSRVVQTCVVTLEEIENDIEEHIGVTFAPPSLIPSKPRIPSKDDGEDAAEIPDLPEPIVDGQIDLGELAGEFLMLAIEPYPRKPGAVFEPPAEEVDPNEHPFAALKALKSSPAPGKTKKDN